MLPGSLHRSSQPWRGQVGQYGLFSFTAGFLSLPMIAYSTRTCWRTLYKILSLFHNIYSIVFLPFVSESPRWLLVMGRSKEALDVLKSFARLNGKKLPLNLSLANPNKTGCDEGIFSEIFHDNQTGKKKSSKNSKTKTFLLVLYGFMV